MIDLQPFCSKDRAIINVPWSDGDKTIASDGAVMIMVERRADVPENVLAPNYRACLTGTYGEPVPLPPFERVPAHHGLETCEACRGKGTIPKFGIQEWECVRCKGGGKVVVFNAGVEVGGLRFNPWYLGLIADLPNVKFYTDPAGGRHGMAKFTFDGGEGCLLPLKIEKEVEVKKDPLWDAQEMAGKAPDDQARLALLTVLQRCHEHHLLGYYIGLGTTTWNRLTEAYATLSSQPVRKVREQFAPKKARAPKEPELTSLVESLIASLEERGATSEAAEHREQLNKLLGRKENQPS